MSESTDIWRLIAEASVLAGAPHHCSVLGHRWRHMGGRNCGCENLDADGERWTGRCSVPVYECEACGDCDYGDNAEARERIADCSRSEVMLYA